MSKRFIKDYIKELKNKTKESLTLLEGTEVKDTETIRNIIVNMNNMIACVREYEYMLETLSSNDIDE